MREDIQQGDLVTLKSYVHRKAWENVGIVQWTRGLSAAVRWIRCEDSLDQLDLNKYPVTQRYISELEAFTASDLASQGTERNATETW